MTLPHLLLIGPLPNDADVIGGTKVAFAGLVQELGAAQRFRLEVHDTTRPRAGRGRLRQRLDDARQLGAVLRRLLQRSSRPDAVMFNTSSGGLLLAGPLIWAACRLRGLRLAVRVFGGDLDNHIERAIRPVRRLASQTFLRADLLLLETRALCKRLTDGRARQWPNTRDCRRSDPRGRRRARRFLFVGQLRREKGAAEAVRAAASLPPGASLTLYGPSMPGFDLEPLLEGSPCEFGGPLGSTEVPRVLEEHDVLIFPSYHSGEGLPGIIIEAFQLGLPVIAADWRSVPELVEHEVNGLLVDARDADGLAEAMNRIAGDEILFQRLCSGAATTGEEYRSTRWNELLLSWLEELCGVQPALEQEPATLEEAA